MYHWQGKYEPAERLFKYTLKRQQALFGPLQPGNAVTHYNLARIYHAQGREAEALVEVRRATEIHRKRAAEVPNDRWNSNLGKRQSARFIFAQHVSLAHLIATRQPELAPALRAEAFKVAQLASTATTPQSVARMAARFAAQDDVLAALIRKRQDAMNRWHALDSKLIKLASVSSELRDPSGEDGIRKELRSVDETVTAFDRELANVFPGTPT